MSSLEFYRLVQNLPFPKRQISESSKLKEFSDDNFEFDENSKKFSKRVETTVDMNCGSRAKPTKG